MLVLSFRSIGHLLLDEMWRQPAVLFWPLCGWGFPETDISNSISKMFHALGTDPVVLVPEVIGAIIVMGFSAWLITNHNVLSFIRDGTMK